MDTPDQYGNHIYKYKLSTMFHGENSEFLGLNLKSRFLGLNLKSSHEPESVSCSIHYLYKKKESLIHWHYPTRLSIQKNNNNNK